ncbi:MAG: LysR family transcriptional regulator [Anaerocolumna sp.]
MDLHYLKIFNTVAKYTSFRKASEVLHISQPALSIQVKKLENQTGVKLFDKIGNKIHLSEAGSLLYGYTQRIFALVEEVEHKISNHSNVIDGTINLGASNTPGAYILPIIIGKMKKMYPQVTINLYVGDTSEITNLIENGTLDLAVNGGGCNYNDNIYSKKLFDDRLVIVASPENPLSHLEEVTLVDLEDENFIVHSSTSQLFTCYKNFIDAYNIPENIGMHFGSIDAIKYALYANLGVSIMPYYSVKFEVKMGLLKELKINCDKIAYSYSLIYNKNKYITPTSQKFIELLMDENGEAVVK